MVMPKQESITLVITNRQYAVAGYHYKSCQHYADTHDWEKMFSHSQAADMVMTSSLTEEDWKKYRNFCISNKITHYKYLPQ